MRRANLLVITATLFLLGGGIFSLYCESYDSSSYGGQSSSTSSGNSQSGSSSSPTCYEADSSGNATTNFCDPTKFESDPCLACICTDSSGATQKIGPCVTKESYNGGSSTCSDWVTTGCRPDPSSTATSSTECVDPYKAEEVGEDSASCNQSDAMSGDGTGSTSSGSGNSGDYSGGGSSGGDYGDYSGGMEGEGEYGSSEGFGESVGELEVDECDVGDLCDAIKDADTTLYGGDGDGELFGITLSLEESSSGKYVTQSTSTTSTDSTSSTYDQNSEGSYSSDMSDGSSYDQEGQYGEDGGSGRPDFSQCSFIFEGDISKICDDGVKDGIVACLYNDTAYGGIPAIEVDKDCSDSEAILTVTVDFFSAIPEESTGFFKSTESEIKCSTPEEAGTATFTLTIDPSSFSEIDASELEGGQSKFESCFGDDITETSASGARGTDGESEKDAASACGSRFSAISVREDVSLASQSGILVMLLIVLSILRFRTKK